MAIEIIYDGEGYYVVATDAGSIRDALVVAEVNVPSIELTEHGQIYDSVYIDTITNIIDEPEYLILKTSAIHIDDIASATTLTYDDYGNAIFVSDKFIWKISNTGQLIHRKFLYPNISGKILNTKFYNNKLYVFYSTIIPEDTYIVATDVVGLLDSTVTHFKGKDKLTYYDYVPYILRFPPPQFNQVKLPAYSIFNLDSYDIDSGEIIDSVGYSSGKLSEANTNKLLSPTCIDIFNNNLYVTDMGDATVKVFDLGGLYLFSALKNILVQPYQIYVEDENYVWIADSTRVTLYYNYHIIKCDIMSESIVNEHSYKVKPKFVFSKRQNRYNIYTLTKESGLYKLYKDFVYNQELSGLLNAHSVNMFEVAKLDYLYCINTNPFDIRILNLNTKSTCNIRECNEPVTVVDLHVEDDKVLIADTGLQEVGFYHLFGQKDSIFIDHLYPKGITKVASDFYVTDSINKHLYKLSNGNIQKLENGDLIKPFDIASDGEFLYILDLGKNSVVKTTLEGVTVSIIGKPGKYDGEFNYPTSLSIDNDTLYVLDSGNFKVQKFSLTGEFLESILLSPPLVNETTYVAKTLSLSSIDDDCWEDVYGYCKTYSASGAAPLYGLRFNIDSLPARDTLELLEVKLILKGTFQGDISLVINLEDTLTPVSYTTGYDTKLIYRDVDTLPTDINKISVKAYNYQTSLVSNDIKSLVQSVMDKHPVKVSNEYLSFIIYSTVSGYTAIGDGTSTLQLKYNIVKKKRSKGLFHHLVVDDNNFYVSDIANHIIYAYDKTSSKVVDTYAFKGTVMEKLTNDIFITNRNCAISYLSKFNWELECKYNLELEQDADRLLYTFEPSWETVEYTEIFEQNFTSDFIDTFEWVEDFIWAEVSTTDQELSVPTIDWRI